MPTGEQNNIKARLQELHTMPSGFHFDQTRTWQSLEVGLHPKRKPRPVFWYAAAVACAVVLALVWLDRRSESALQPKPIVHLNRVLLLPAKNTPVQETVHEERAVQPKRHVLKKPEIMNSIAIEQRVRLDPAIEIQPVKLPLAEPVNSITAGIPKKQKFRVAHINELNNQNGSPPRSENTTATASSFKKPFLSTMQEESTSAEEKIVLKKRQKNIFSQASSSQ